MYQNNANTNKKSPDFIPGLFSEIKINLPLNNQLFSNHFFIGFKYQVINTIG